MMHSVAIGVAAVLSFLLASPACSYPITFSFTAEVASVGSLIASGPIHVGDAVSGSFTFESTATDGFPGDPIFGAYAAAAFQARFGSYAVEAAGASLSIRNDDPINSPPSDSYNVRANVVNGAPITGGLDTPKNLTFQLFDPSATAFSSDALPLAPPPLSAFTSANTNTSFVIVNFGTGTSTLARQVRSRVVSLSILPEPSSAWLTSLSGLACVLAFRASRGGARDSS